MSYLDLARQALEKLPQSVREASKPPDQRRQADRKPWSLTAEEEATICRVIEGDQGLPPGSLRLYTPEQFWRLTSLSIRKELSV
jgi:hypothetical protein